MDVGGAGFIILAIGALLVGFSKTGISGTATVSVALFAMVLPARESTGVLLLLLMTGDALAVWTYRGHAEWSIIRRLLAPVAVGIAVGVAFLAWAPAGWIAPVIGAIVMFMSALNALRMWRARASRRAKAAAPPAEGVRPMGTGISPGGDAVARFFGSLAGFTTMVANAGGPVMTLYLLRSNLEVTRFVGTLAWFFATVNLVKLPFSIGLGLIQPQRLELVVLLIPLVLAGAAAGRALVTRISRPAFDVVILAVAFLSGVWLLIG